MTGGREMANNLRGLARKVEAAAERAVFKFANIEMTEMKRRTPVDTGTLRDSGKVDEPIRRGNELSVTLGFGGAAEEYALDVHEDLEAFHRVGQAKFASSVLNESEPHFESRVGADVRADLGLGL